MSGYSFCNVRLMPSTVALSGFTASCGVSAAICDAATTIEHAAAPTVTRFSDRAKKIRLNSPSAWQFAKFAGVPSHAASAASHACTTWRGRRPRATSASIRRW